MTNISQNRDTKKEGASPVLIRETPPRTRRRSFVDVLRGLTSSSSLQSRAYSRFQSPSSPPSRSHSDHRHCSTGVERSSLEILADANYEVFEPKVVAHHATADHPLSLSRCSPVSEDCHNSFEVNYSQAHSHEQQLSNKYLSPTYPFVSAPPTPTPIRRRYSPLLACHPSHGPLTTSATPRLSRTRSRTPLFVLAFPVLIVLFHIYISTAGITLSGGKSRSVSHFGKSWSKSQGRGLGAAWGFAGMRHRRHLEQDGVDREMVKEVHAWWELEHRHEDDIDEREYSYDSRKHEGKQQHLPVPGSDSISETTSKKEANGVELTSALDEGMTTRFRLSQGQMSGPEPCETNPSSKYL